MHGVVSGEGDIARAGHLHWAQVVTFFARA
jgi:hypothetical protein